jgi:hypothetical protein
MARGVTGRCVQDDLHVLTRLALAVVEPPSSFTPKALHMHVDASYVNELDTAGCTVVILAESSARVGDLSRSFSYWMGISRWVQ